MNIRNFLNKLTERLCDKDDIILIYKEDIERIIELLKNIKVIIIGGSYIYQPHLELAIEITKNIEPSDIVILNFQDKDLTKKKEIENKYEEVKIGLNIIEEQTTLENIINNVLKNFSKKHESYILNKEYLKVFTKIEDDIENFITEFFTERRITDNRKKHIDISIVELDPDTFIHFLNEFSVFLLFSFYTSENLIEKEIYREFLKFFYFNREMFVKLYVEYKYLNNFLQILKTALAVNANVRGGLTYEKRKSLIFEMIKNLKIFEKKVEELTQELSFIDLPLPILAYIRRKIAVSVPYNLYFGNYEKSFEELSEVLNILKEIKNKYIKEKVEECVEMIERVKNIMKEVEENATNAIERIIDRYKKDNKSFKIVIISDAPFCRGIKKYLGLNLNIETRIIYLPPPSLEEIDTDSRIISEYYRNLIKEDI